MYSSRSEDYSTNEKRFEFWNNNIFQPFMKDMRKSKYEKNAENKSFTPEIVYLW